MIFETKFLAKRQHEVDDEAAAAERWRAVILKLSNNMMEAAGDHEHLSPVLIEALHNALENLLLLGDETDLLELEEWLDHDSSTREAVRAAQNAAPDHEVLSEEQDKTQRSLESQSRDQRFSDRNVISHSNSPVAAEDTLPESAAVDS
jgi:hypothetical protein